MGPKPEDLMVRFFYILLRDYVPVGAMTRVMRDVEQMPKVDWSAPMYHDKNLEAIAREFAGKLIELGK